MTIIYGGASNLPANVNKDGQIASDSITRSKDNFINGQTGKMWSLSFSGVDPAGADDKFLYLKNTGSEPLRITDIRVSSTVAGIVSVKKC
ncbi:unnamed protein product, partial [marine sediment metagenome]